jgi:hypothetical protein
LRQGRRRESCVIIICSPHRSLANNMSFPSSLLSGVDSSPGGYPCPPTEETISSANAVFYASWEQSSDIRGDWTTGWGSDGNLSLGRQVSAASAESQSDGGDQWGWRLQNSAVRHVPTFYPMDSRSTRRIDLSAKIEVKNDVNEMNNPSEVTSFLIEDVSYRISTACQRLSIYGVWDNMCPSAALCSMEFVEMEVNIYLGEADGAGEVLQIIPWGRYSLTFSSHFSFPRRTIF